MNSIVTIARLMAVCGIVATLGACASNYPTRTASYTETPLHRPDTPPGDSELFGVRIEAFDPGTLPTDPKLAKGLSPDIRNAESYYVAVQLRSTMQKSGHWGAVRVTPRGGREGEVVITGTILESDGEILKLEVEVKDAAGVRWFKRTYESVVDAAAYTKAENNGIDAFQDLYNRIANDLAAYRMTLTPEETKTIRQVADLRFGSEFAPKVYDAYLEKPEQVAKKDDDAMQQLVSLLNSVKAQSKRSPQYMVKRLPSEDDPVVERVNRIRGREELLVDTLDQQYDVLARSLSEPYNQWRTSRLKEIKAIREVDRVKNEEQAKAVAVGVIGLALGVALASQNRGGNCYSCSTAGVAVAGAAVAIGVQMAIQASQQAESEAGLHKAALEEMGNSMASDVKPTVVEVEGKTVELKGSIEEKFKAWRQLLEDLRNQEIAPLTTEPAKVSS